MQQRQPLLTAQKAAQEDWDWDAEDDAWGHADDWDTAEAQAPRRAPKAAAASEQGTGSAPQAGRPTGRRRTTMKFVAFATVLAVTLLYLQTGSVAKPQAQSAAVAGAGPAAATAKSAVGAPPSPVGAVSGVKAAGGAAGAQQPSLSGRAPPGMAAITEKQCQEWSLAGECHRNPAYMLARCTAACSRLSNGVGGSGVGAKPAGSPPAFLSAATLATGAASAAERLASRMEATAAGGSTHDDHLGKAAAAAEAMAQAVAKAKAEPTEEEREAAVNR